MGIDQRIETFSKVLNFLTELVKFCALAAIAAFVVATLANPSWAQRRLKALNLQVKEVSFAGVKLVANETFEVANSLVDAKINLESAATLLSSTANASEVNSRATESSVKEALKHIEKMQLALNNQEGAIKEVGTQAGLPVSDIPATGWVYAGRISDGGAFQAGPRVDAKITNVSGGKLTRLQLKYDAPVVGNGNDCTRTNVADAPLPTAEDLQRIQVLLRADPVAPLNVLETAECPSIGNGKFIYARIAIPKDRVRFAKFSDAVK